MKNIYKIAGVFLLSALLFSCSSTRKLSKASELTMITDAAEQGNVMFLIEALEQYPLYRGYTESFLYDKDYSKVEYGRLKQYATAAQNDAEATIFFDSLLIHKQSFVIDSLSQRSITEVGEFYKYNHSEHDYLRDVLYDAYFSDVKSLDYKNRKTLYEAFKDTDLSSEIEQPYHDLRDSLMVDVMGALNSYFASERELLHQIEDVVRYESQQYIEAGLEKILLAANEKNDRGLFKQIFKRKDIDNYSFKEYVNKTINEAYDYQYIEHILNDRLLEYLMSSKEMRSMLFNQYFNDAKYQNIYIPNDALKTRLVWVIGRDDVSNIQDIKDVGTALTVGSIALGFIPGIGAVAIAADVVDLAYGLGQDGKINQATEQLANTIYKDSSICIDDYLSSVFNSLKESQQSTENNIRKIFNDEF